MMNRKQTRRKEKERKKIELVFYDRLFESTGQCGVMGSSPGSAAVWQHIASLSQSFLSVDFPGSPVVKTLYSQCRGYGFNA